MCAPCAIRPALVNTKPPIVERMFTVAASDRSHPLQHSVRQFQQRRRQNRRTCNSCRLRPGSVFVTAMSVYVSSAIDHGFETVPAKRAMACVF